MFALQFLCETSPLTEVQFVTTAADIQARAEKVFAANPEFDWAVVGENGRTLYTVDRAGNRIDPDAPK